MMTPEWLAELRRVAEAATPGPWEWREREHNERIRKRGRAGRRSRRQFVYCLQGPPLSGVAPEHRDEFDYHNVMSLRWDQVKATVLTGVAPTPVDADFIATFDPPTVLALLNEIERLRREREVLVEAVRGWGDYQNAVRKYGLASVEVARVLEGAQRRHKSVLALLDGEGGGGE